MRVAFVIPDMHIGGAEKIALVLIREFVRLGHEVDLVMANASGGLLELLPDGVNVIDTKSRRLRHMFRPLTHYFRRCRPDATLVFMWPLNVVAVLAHRVARAKGRLIVSEHTTLSSVHSKQRVGHWTFLTNSIRLAYPMADARVIVSNDAADDLSRVAHVPRPSLTVIANPIDMPDDARRNPEAVDWGGPGVRVLAVGSLKLIKDHRLLLDGFAILARNRSARLIILGEGDLRNQLVRHAIELGIADRVGLPGQTTDPWPYYRSADLFALTSRGEGFGNVLVEAMIAGIPVISTDCPSGPREILDDGRFGRLVPVGDADALGLAMAQTLDEPFDPAPGKAQAERLCGQSVEQYVELMIGDR